MMAAHTRMPGHVSASEKTAFVEDLIKRLGLTKAADSVVGDKKKRGLSGGEKKRLSIGAELIAQPTLLFTDEPTTGLDSFQAEKVHDLDTALLYNSKFVRVADQGCSTSWQVTTIFAMAHQMMLYLLAATHQSILKYQLGHHETILATSPQAVLCATIPVLVCFKLDP